MVGVLNKQAKMPQRRGVVRRIEHPSLITDVWMSCANDSYQLLTMAYINDESKLVTLVLNCSKKEGSQTEEDMADAIQTFVKDHGLSGHVMTSNTDCELSMVKLGRLLADRDVFTRVRYTNHRLESATGQVFNGPGVKKSMVLDGGVVTR